MTLDLAVLCLAIDLFSIPLPLGPKEEIVGSDFMSLYLCTKGWIVSIEGLGINSLEVVQSRLLITLFEVAHGLYPAAYISIELQSELQKRSLSMVEQMWHFLCP